MVHYSREEARQSSDISGGSYLAFQLPVIGHLANRRLKRTPSAASWAGPFWVFLLSVLKCKQWCASDGSNSRPVRSQRAALTTRDIPYLSIVICVKKQIEHSNFFRSFFLSPVCVSFSSFFFSVLFNFSIYSFSLNAWF